jgi:hypothetical protein
MTNKEFKKEYYLANRETILPKQREYYNNNIEARRAYQREYYHANKDK